MWRYSYSHKTLKHFLAYIICDECKFIKTCSWLLTILVRKFEIQKQSANKLHTWIPLKLFVELEPIKSCRNSTVKYLINFQNIVSCMISFLHKIMINSYTLKSNFGWISYFKCYQNMDIIILLHDNSVIFNILSYLVLISKKNNKV